MKIICWNVNGIRAVMKKDFLAFLEKENPDVLCLQETKIKGAQLTQELLNPLGYFSTWAHADRAGYSGTVTYSKKKPLQTQIELGSSNAEHDKEGRLIFTEFEGPTANFTLVNVYVPNGGQGDHRIQFKLDYYDEMLDVLEKRRKAGENLIICGDFNTAHHPIDLARPRENENTTGFLPVERAWLDKFTAAGYIDTFRHEHPETYDAYTWWSYRSAARERNVGWRIDYFFANQEFLPHVKRAEIMSEIYGSDHCPILLELA